MPENRGHLFVPSHVTNRALAKRNQTTETPPTFGSAPLRR